MSRVICQDSLLRTSNSKPYSGVSIHASLGNTRNINDFSCAWCRWPVLDLTSRLDALPPVSTSKVVHTADRTKILVPTNVSLACSALRLLGLARFASDRFGREIRRPKGAGTVAESGG